jgi:hypothetical protein
MTADADAYLPPEATGSAPGRARLAGRRLLVVGASYVKAQPLVLDGGATSFG